MKNLLGAGAIALAVIVLLWNVPPADATETGMSQTQTSVASINIGRIRSVLKLTLEQERYWRPVEAALRDLARRQDHAEQGGFVHRVGQRVVSIVLNSVAIERLATAARPLIARLSSEQKQAAGQLAQEMGLGPVVMAALN